MPSDLAPSLPEIAARFSLESPPLKVVPWGSGNVHDTYAVLCSAPRRYILQRINSHVFSDVQQLMLNIQRVTEHIRSKTIAELGEVGASRSTISIIPTSEGLIAYRDSFGHWWRCYAFIEGTRVHEKVNTPAQAYEFAKAFGNFQKLIADLPKPRLAETIPHFHNTRKRFERFRSAVAADPLGRSRIHSELITMFFAREEMVDVLLDQHSLGRIPERITHNDTKIDNLLFDHLYDHALCVVDLDTVMPGLALYDFGDMVRSVCNATVEDDSMISRVEILVPLFKAIAEGYYYAAGTILNATERSYLPFSARLMAFEQSIRFFTDYIEGDHYYKTTKPEHNLARARNQFQLLLSMEAHNDEMQRIIDRLPII